MKISSNGLTVHEASKLLKEKKISSVELTKEYLERIKQVDSKVKAFVTVTEEPALKSARSADAAIASGKAGPLTGIPVAVKDNMCAKGVKTTCSSKMLENFVPPYNASVVKKLNDAGAVIVGKCNMDEFAMGSSTENSAFFTSRNPWDLERVPGGSSGGAAVAVAAQEAICSLGSDTGGSIRQPAGFCSVVGMKPTYGRVSRYGLIAFASSLDQIGPFSQDVTDCAILMNIISGHDRCDSTSVPEPVPDYTKSLKADIKGMKLGIPKEYYVEGMQKGVADAMKASIKKLEELGARVEEVSLPHTPYALAVYYIIAPSECSANLARYDGVKYGYSFKGDTMWESMEKTRENGFGPEVKRRIMIGTYALSAGYYDAWYLKAQKVRTLIRREFDEVFKNYDALITPTSPTVPFKIGERSNDPLAMYLSDVCTLPINIAGVPAVSIQGGFADGLPVGLQVIGKSFGEETILKVAYAYEQATEWHKKRAEIKQK